MCFQPHTNTYFQDGEVSGEEFKQAVKDACVGKNFDEFPSAFRVFIINQFKMVDFNGMFAKRHLNFINPVVKSSLFFVPIFTPTS